MGNILLAVLFMLFFPIMKGERKFLPGIESGTSLSYSGFSQNLLLTIRSEKNLFYLGPRTSLTQQYLTGIEVYGINTGIRHHFANTGNLFSFFSIDYQNSFLRPYNFDKNARKLNSLHEFNFSYGISYRIFPKLSLANSIGFGRYLEIFQDLNRDIPKYFQGYSGLIKAFIIYEF
jgi:hypothetical protein